MPAFPWQPAWQPCIWQPAFLTALKVRFCQVLASDLFGLIAAFFRLYFSDPLKITHARQLHSPYGEGRLFWLYLFGLIRLYFSEPMIRSRRTRLPWQLIAPPDYTGAPVLLPPGVMPLCV
jgi:hypothetical protein